MNESFREILNQYLEIEEEESYPSRKTCFSQTGGDLRNENLAFMLSSADLHSLKKTFQSWNKGHSIYKNQRLPTKEPAEKIEDSAPTRLPFTQSEDRFPANRNRFAAHSLNPQQRSAFAVFQQTLPFFPVDFTKLDLKIGFRALAKMRHPDTGGSSQSFQELKESYALLLKITN